MKYQYHKTITNMILNMFTKRIRIRVRIAETGIQQNTGGELRKEGAGTITHVRTVKQA
ncbi:hypothetical protein TSAR_007909 [Trichomalopsis sarcophagae]|uniref:Uncharacterized protein n=1 Tax=Trichomalopsis sarcophagae TaxID=543379 RepID=A0A232FM42_9HYME|nr:hypothetical protein TSAR_007909 [Trichomalopsis sarcophagae]